MNRLVPYLAALQWIGGLVLALSASGRAREFRQQGTWPRAMAKIALGLFVIAAVIVALSAPALAPIVARVVPAFDNPSPWRLAVFLTACQAGWILVLVSMGWTGLLGIVSRKRHARAELDRRRERAQGHTDHDTR
ncbi:MAG TPA: hypothetical protein VFW04_14280 [Gemmatimonadaceae bacterium]|nr:hypothetical protein [Gemmatimonadaceae bacterium]